MSQYTVEQVAMAFRAGFIEAAKWPSVCTQDADSDAVYTAADAYAATLRQQAARVDEAPEGCTPADAIVLRKANHSLAGEIDALRQALQFYADKDHFMLGEEDAWDTVSGEPQNYWCDEAGTATVEDGSVARAALEAALSAQPAPPTYTHGADGSVMQDNSGDPGYWTTQPAPERQGAVAFMAIGPTGKVVSDNIEWGKQFDNEASRKNGWAMTWLYTHTAAPVGVPDEVRWVLQQAKRIDREAWAKGAGNVSFEAIKGLSLSLEAMDPAFLAAAPSAPQGTQRVEGCQHSWVTPGIGPTQCCKCKALPGDTHPERK